jgi:hypothetical protein
MIEELAELVKQVKIVTLKKDNLLEQSFLLQIEHNKLKKQVITLEAKKLVTELTLLIGQSLYKGT